MPPDFTTLDWEKAGMATILGLWIVAFLRGWIVAGSEYRQRVAERDKQTELASRAIDAMQLLMRDGR